MPMFSVPMTFVNEIKVITNQGECTINNNKQLEHILGNIF